MAEMTIQQALELALRHHEAGELQQAEAIYRQVLAVEPTNVDALHLLGVIAGAVGRHDAAEELIGRAIARRGDIAEFHRNLGLAQQALGKFAKAYESFTRAAELKPQWAEVHARRGALLGVMGKIDEAIAAGGGAGAGGAGCGRHAGEPGEHAGDERGVG